MIETATITCAFAGSTLLPKISSDLQLVLDEPSQWSVKLDNSDRDYNPSSSLGNPRTYVGTFLLRYLTPEGGTFWDSPDLVLEDYDYNTETVTISGRCRLSQLDVNDQVFGDFEDTTISSILTVIATEYGLTVSGAPSTAVTIFRGFGNPLEMFRSLLGPTHTFRMGSGNQIIVEPVTVHLSGPNVTDEDEIEVLRFKRSSVLYNKATVERVENTGGVIVLADEERSDDGGGSIYAAQEVNLSSPSRSFTIVYDFGQRGKLQNFVAWDEDGLAIGPISGTRTYVGTTACAKITFDYILNSSAGDPDRGPFTATWHVKLVGLPADAEPPSEDFSQTAQVGAGDRPYPEPFTSIARENAADALLAAQALAHVGARQGNALSAEWRLLPALIGYPNQTFGVTDWHSGLTGPWICETLGISDDENSDTGTITMEATRVEES